MLRRFLRRALPVAAGVVLAVVPSVGCSASAASASRVPGAPAAATPGWRVVRFLAGATTGGLSVPGPRDAWLAGIDNLAWIPGTRSPWATGGFDADAGEAILKYGP